MSLVNVTSVHGSLVLLTVYFLSTLWHFYPCGPGWKISAFRTYFPEQQGPLPPPDVRLGALRVGQSEAKSTNQKIMKSLEVGLIEKKGFQVFRWAVRVHLVKSYPLLLVELLLCC